MASSVDGDLIVRGGLAAQSMSIPSGAIGNAQVAAGANIDAAKLKHAHRANYAQESATNATAEARVVHVVVGATAVVQAFKAGCVVVAIGSATATVDIKKNGTSILSGGTPITLNSSNTIRVPVSGTVTTTAAVAGDVFEVVITATSGGGTLAKGIFAALDIWEDAS